MQLSTFREDVKKQRTYVAIGRFDNGEYIREGVSLFFENLSAELMPEYWGIGEATPRNRGHTIHRPSEIASYLKKHSGMYLFGKGIKYNITLHNSTQLASVIEVWFSGREALLLDHGYTVCDRLLKMGSSFGFACHYAEYVFRNYCIFDFQGGSSGSFVGRDHRRYIPGLYWMNYYSHDYCNAIGLDMREIAELLNSKERYSAKGIVVSAYESPSKWEAHSDYLTSIIKAHPIFFDISKVERETNLSARDLLHTDNIPSRLWP